MCRSHCHYTGCRDDSRSYHRFTATPICQLVWRRHNWHRLRSRQHQRSFPVLGILQGHRTKTENRRDESITMSYWYWIRNAETDGNCWLSTRRPLVVVGRPCKFRPLPVLLGQQHIDCLRIFFTNPYNYLVHAESKQVFSVTRLFGRAFI